MMGDPCIGQHSGHAYPCTNDEGLFITDADKRLSTSLPFPFSHLFQILSDPSPPKHTHTDAHKYTHRQMHTPIHTHIYTYTDSSAHTHTHTHTVTYPTGNQILASVYQEVISYYVTKLVLMKCMGICEDNECISIFNIVYFKCFISN